MGLRFAEFDSGAGIQSNWPQDERVAGYAYARPFARLSGTNRIYYASGARPVQSRCTSAAELRQARERGGLNLKRLGWIGVPSGIRTRVTAVKGLGPGPG